VVVLTSYTDPRLVGTKLSQLPPGALYLRKQDVSELTALRAAIMRAAARGNTALGRVMAPAGLGAGLTDTQVETMRIDGGDVPIEMEDDGAGNGGAPAGLGSSVLDEATAERWAHEASPSGGTTVGAVVVRGS
jgi:hypothetical protein